MAMLASASGYAQDAKRLQRPGPMRLKTQLKNLLPSSRIALPHGFKASAKSVDASTVIWGNTKQNGQWGYYSFNPTAPMEYKLLGKQDERICKNGVQLADGKLYTVNFERYGVGSGELTLYTYDLSTWTGTKTTSDDYRLAALETAQAADGTVYGEFYNNVASNQTYELGTVDYRTKTRTTFGNTRRRYVAMGVTSDNILYGIATDGNLYKISTTDGSETLVGSTGVQVVEEEGDAPGNQTGEIDQKDDTFYWYCYDYNWNTALYTVDLATGKATMISEDSEEITGMIIPQSTAAADEAPAAATNLAATFSGTSLTGTVSFTAPSVSANGTLLKNTLSYTVTANGTELAKGTVEPGATATANVTVAAAGTYTFVVTLSNAAGNSTASVEQQVGGGASAPVTLWGNCKHDYQWGYYSINASDPIKYTALGTQDARICKNGAQIADGKLYTVNFERYGVGSGELTLYTYDLSTWKGTKTTLDNFCLAALETAQAADGTVYGEFYDRTASKELYELGTVDYRTQTRTTFGFTTRRYVAMGVTSDNVLYGIDEDAKLYKISTTDGKSTLIGSTGIALKDDWGGPYDQTGEIDPKDNTFYWYSQDADYKTVLYTVDLNTAAVTKIATGDATMTGMMIAPAAAADDAPAAATDVKALFEGTSLTGTVSFTAPTLSTNGEQLTGSLSYKITANGTEVASGTVMPGKTENAAVTLDKSGAYTFEVVVSNAAGAAPAATADHWVGFDEPVAVGNPTATVKDGIVTISWTAPAEGVHQGVLGNITYDVVHKLGTETKEIATGITETSYTDDISDAQLSNYVYSVRAVSGGVQGSWADAPALIAGAAIEPDWNYVFEGNSALALFTVIDGNNDKNTWWCNGVHGYGAMSNQQRATIESDDWLITPPLHMTKERVYTVSFRVRNIMDNIRNTMEVCWGNGNTPAQLNHKLFETFTPEFSETNGEWQVCTADIIPDADGIFYIGFHDNTKVADKYQVAVDNITVKMTAYTAAPDSVKSLEIVPAEKGALSATVKFTAPSVNLVGNKLQKSDSFEVVRNGETVGTIAGANAGEQVSWTDNTIKKNGFQNYTITPYLNGNPGRATSAKAYVGIDRPKNPSGVVFSDQETCLHATWNDIEGTGANGGYLDPKTVTTSFYSLVDDGWGGFDMGDLLVESKAGETSVTVPVDPNVTTMGDGKTQTIAWYGVMAKSEDGQSDCVTARGVVIGPSINLPFKESFKNAALDNGFASLLGNEQYNNRRTSAAWRVVSDDASDYDGGCAVWANYTEPYGDTEIAYTIMEGDETSVNMPKVSLKGATKPTLFFDLNSLVGNEASLQVVIQTPDGSDNIEAEYDLRETQENGWTRKAVDLSAYAGERFVIVKFNGVAHGSKVLIGVDNINLIDQYERNMAAIDIKAPEKMVAGKTAEVKVAVQNHGTQTADKYTVELYAGSKLVDKADMTNALATLDCDTARLSLPVAINETAANLEVKAKVIFDGDLYADDDITRSATVWITPSSYGTVKDLKAENDADGNAVLTWGLPVLPEPKTITDGFESYSPFSTEMSPWTLVDMDKSLAGALQPESTYQGQGKAFAFTAFNPDWWMENMTQVNPGLSPCNGEQFAAAIYGMDADNKLVAQDNWMISPRLSGRKQRISFYVMNLAAGGMAYAENFDVLYSTEGTDIENFVKIDSYKADGTVSYNEGANWKYVTVEIPEGARYFAIRHNTPKRNAYIFGIDDVKYEQLAVGADDNITEYVVYRDGVQLARVAGDAHTYTDNSAEKGTHVYNVTVVYTSADKDTNESGFSNDATVTTSAIDAVEGESSFDVTTLGGVRMKKGAKNLNGLKKDVYIVNGKKRVLK